MKSFSKPLVATALVAVMIATSVYAQISPPPALSRPPMDGSGSPMPLDGSHPPLDGSHPPFDGSHPPFDGSRPPKDGSFPPMPIEGSHPPKRRCRCQHGKNSSHPINGTRLPPMNGTHFNGTHFNGTRFPPFNGTHFNGTHPHPHGGPMDGRPHFNGTHFNGTRLPPFNGTHFNGTRLPPFNGTHPFPHDGHFNGTHFDGTPFNGTHFNGTRLPPFNGTHFNGTRLPPFNGTHPHPHDGPMDGRPPMMDDGFDCPCPEDMDPKDMPGAGKNDVTRAPRRAAPRLRLRLTGNSWRQVLDSNRSTLEARVRMDLAKSLNVSASRINIIDMQIGSLVVDFEVEAKADGTYEESLSSDSAIQSVVENAEFTNAISAYAASGANDTVTVSNVYAVNTTLDGSAASDVSAFAAVLVALVTTVMSSII